MIFFFFFYDSTILPNRRHYTPDYCPLFYDSGEEGYYV